MRPNAAVLDASVTAPWFLPDEASELSDRVYALMRRGAIRFRAPELWTWECGNIIASAVRRRRLLPADAEIAWNAVDSVRDRLEVVESRPGHVAEALQIALADGLSVYDAAYLRLAQDAGLPLLTADHVLAKAATARGIAALGLGDLG